jgi:CDP-diacylglycerol---serine O-phosphatidyltransferase
MKQQPKEYAENLRKRAQEQAHSIIYHAQIQAQRIVDQAKQEAVKTQQRVKLVGEQARVARDNAVRLFRINLANTLTLFNGVCGFLSILASIQHQYMLAAILILSGVLFDWFDGKAARAFGETSPLGGELDSLSDLITFGVAPAVLVAMIAPSLFSFGAGALFVLSAALRLARFNVQQVKGMFFGVPTTTNGILLPLMIFLGAPVIAFPWYLVIFALLMNAPIKIRKVF